MRTKKAPLKGVRNEYARAETTIVLLTCLPHESGYYRQRFQVVRACLSSILKHTDADFDLMVVDNGSLRHVTDWLVRMEQQGYIDHLILNKRNLGLSGALNIAYSAAPGKYIAFSNDDVFFHPNWLSAHLQILQTFPRVGLVSGQLAPGPDRQDEVVQVAREHNIPFEEFVIPDDWIQQFAASVGMPLEQYLARPWAQRNRNTYVLEKDGCKAYVGKTGYAHVFPKDILRSVPCFPFETGYLAGDSTDRQMANAIKDAGYLWLCTSEKTTEHMGNQLDEHFTEMIEACGLSSMLDDADAGSQLRRSLPIAGSPGASGGRGTLSPTRAKGRAAQVGAVKAIRRLLKLRHGR